MQKVITLKNREVPYTLRISKRARHMYISVSANKGLAVTTPMNFPSRKAEKFLIQKSDWILEKIKYFSTFPKITRMRNTKANYVKHKAAAQILAEEKIKKFNELYKFKFTKIYIKNQKTRWGSCSKKGTLNFNYRIVLLPERIAEYIVVHELCHLAEFNHSQKFWNLVGQTIPEYKELRKDLRRNSLQFY